MKGVVFSLKGNENRAYRGSKFKLSFKAICYYLKRYGLIFIAFGLLFLGLIFGATYSGHANQNFINSLDFLFSTNLEARLVQNALGTFCACFASDFIFLSVVFLLGISPWGIPVLPAILFFKGFGTGLTAGYLFMLYSISGVGFYLLVILPGTFLFCVSLVYLSINAYYCSKRIFSVIISKQPPKQSLNKTVASFCSRSMSLLLMTFCAALLDSALWTLFAGSFNF